MSFGSRLVVESDERAGTRFAPRLPVVTRYPVNHLTMQQIRRGIARQDVCCVQHKGKGTEGRAGRAHLPIDEAWMP